MALNDFPLIINTATGQLVRDFFSNIGPTLPTIRQGDNLRLLISAVRPNPNAAGDPSRPWVYDTLSTNLRAGVGVVGSAPEIGTFTLTFGGDTTGALDFDATASEVQTALNTLTSIITAGGVTVSGVDGGPWQVLFNNVGAQGDITGNGDALYPASLVTVTTRRNGTAGLREIQSIVLELQPAAYTDSFTDFPAAAATVTKIQDGGTDIPDIQRITLDPPPYAGTFTLSFNGKKSRAIPYDATAAEVKTALGTIEGITPDDPTTDADESDVEVTGASPVWDVTFKVDGAITGSQALMTGDASGLSVAKGKIGELDLNTEAIGYLLAGLTEKEVTLEIESADEPFTLLKETITLENDLIPNDPTPPASSVIYLTRDQSDARYLRVPFVSALTGGGTALDGIATADGATDTGHLVFSLLGGQLKGWELISGTNLEDGDSYIRPDDYATTTNEKVWRRCL